MEDRENCLPWGIFFGAFSTATNKMASSLRHCSLKGNGWFWDEKTPYGMKDNDRVDSVLYKLQACESRYCNFMLNCMPNRDGLLDTIFIDLLAEIGKRWKPDLKRQILPDHGPLLGTSIPISSVTASSGNPEYLFEAVKIIMMGNLIKAFFRK